MATDLRDRLSELADHTPPGAPPADLWTRGVRRRRLARAGSAVLVAALVLVLGAGGLAWHAGRTVEPAAPTGQVRLPDRFYAPSPWLHTFDGPPGPLLALIPAEQRSLFHTHEGVVGVTAYGNDYGFLPLPGSALVGQPGDVGLALSPDGGHVAFWVTGATSGRPNTEMESGVTVTGVGIYDAATGRSRVHQIPSVHGLQASLLTWTDASTLVFAYGRIHNDGSGGSSHATYAGSQVWDTDAPAPSPLPAHAMPVYPDGWSSGAARGLLLTAGYQRRWWLVDPHAAESPRRFPVEHPARLPVPSPDLRQVAGVQQGSLDQGYYRLLVARLPRAGSTRPVVFRRVPAGKQWFATVGWAGPGELVALRRLPAVRTTTVGQVMAELDRVDVSTGTYTRIAAVEQGADVADPYSELLARSYLGAPVVHASPPPSPWDPRWTLAGTAVLVAGLGVALLALLRRFRARRP